MELNRSKVEGRLASMMERPRRLRRTAALRQMVREYVVRVDQLIYPFFVVPGKEVTEPILAMPGVQRLSVDRLAEEAQAVADLGIRAVLLFGQPETKDEYGSQAVLEDSVVAKAVQEIKRVCPELIVITDICLCAYTSHGHCGWVENGRIANDPSVRQLCRMAHAHAQAGADIVSPSDMMDGRIGAIRETLDDAHFQDTAILAYSVKYASSYYGPFREAVHSSPQFGDRRTYQMDPANRREALREVRLDIAEGADMVMVKPALPYLDIIRDVSQKVQVPVVAYQVSGEYSQILAAGEKGWIDPELAMQESLTSIHRAGADLIVTYFAKRYAKLVRRG